MPSETPSRASENVVFNVPNVLTMARFVLAIVSFAGVALNAYSWGLGAFIVAAATDWIDGYWARKYNQVTKLGRVFDPFVDKILICGIFTFLVAEPKSGIAAWVSVLIMGREMLVTALRGTVEQMGGDFSAKMAGKLKMVFQCAAAISSLVVLIYHGNSEAVPAWLTWTLLTSVWLAVLSTIYSGLEYVVLAARFLAKHSS